MYETDESRSGHTAGGAANAPRPNPAARAGGHPAAGSGAEPGTRAGAEPAAAATPDPIDWTAPIAVSPAVLARYGAVILDPSTAARVAGQPPVRSTVYIADQLLVSGAVPAADRRALGAVAEEKGLRLVPPVERDGQRARLLAAAKGSGRDDVAATLPELHQLQPLAGQAVVADAWEVLQAFRARIGPEQAGTRHVALNHLLAATKHVHPGPYEATGVVRTPSSSYGDPGWGGRGPVNYLGPRPQRTSLPGRRPVVAVLDTGCGEHHWFPDSPETVVRRNPTVDGTAAGVPLGLHDPVTDPERTGVLTDPLEGQLDPDAGHGTFIAGLIHQVCPDADILAVRIMPSAGAVPEHVLLNALNLLVCRQQLAQQPGNEHLFVDVVSLSLGYYHEQPDDLALDPLLLAPLTALADMGAAIVASAGNDATGRPMFPAAFTTYPPGHPPFAVPLCSVGATNPNATDALFSNAGPWVTHTRPGADLLSTFPVTFNGSAQAAYVLSHLGRLRATIDGDDFSCGFGTWSGTSFAAPVLAGEIARTLIANEHLPLTDLDDKASVARARAAVSGQPAHARSRA